MKKKTCDKCKAFNIDNCKCSLGYHIKYPGIPIEYCPKPLTNKQYVMETKQYKITDPEGAFKKTVKIKLKNIMTNKKSQLHCGACQENFEDTEQLKRHLLDCPAAEVLLHLTNMVYNGADKTGHPIAGFIALANKHAHLIKRYAYSISDEMDTLNRAKLHVELCEKLYFNYSKFKPFESSKILKMPNRHESLVILWKALLHEALK